MKNEKSVKTTSKKALHRFAAAASVLLAVCLVFMMPVSAETHTDHTDWTELTSSTTITSGKYYLSGDLTSPITIPKNAQVTICLNGKSITIDGQTPSGTQQALDFSNFKSVITIENGATLNLYDHVGGGKITCAMGGTPVPINWNSQTFTYPCGAGVFVNGSIFNLYSGNITGCNAFYDGGGVYVTNKGTFNMCGGNILECEALMDGGGGVAVADGSTFNMFGGTVAKCKASGAAGVAVMGTGSSFKMSGGSITDCDATQTGGGVYVTDGASFTLSNSAVIEKCDSVNSGGGVCVSQSASFTMSGGKITDCTVSSSTNGGGGVSLENSASFTMSGGEITKCEASYGEGGGVYMAGSSATISGGKITDCKTGTEDNQKESGVYTNSDLTVCGDAEISGVQLSKLGKDEAVITIPEGQTFSGSITGIEVEESSTSSDEESSSVADRIIVEGTLGENAQITGSSGESSGEESDGENLISELKYTVIWKNYDGTILETDEKVKAGTDPSYDGATPSKPSDDTYYYIFAGWTPAVVVVSGNTEYTATFTAVEIPPAPSSSSSSSKGSDLGNYQYYPRAVPAEGIIDFGTSPVVKGMELPAGSSGRVTLNTMPDFEMPENGFYAFEIDAPGYNLDAKINGGLSFQIKAADLEAEGWTAEDIVLFHGTVAEDGTITWEALPTSLVEVENGIAYYKAVINGCSPFYIGFVEDGSIVNEPVVEPSDEPTDVPQDVPGEDLPDIPGVQDEPEEPSTPAPILAVLAGLGAAVVLRRK